MKIHKRLSELGWNGVVMKRVVEITWLEGLPRSHRTFSMGFILNVMRNRWRILSKEVIWILYSKVSAQSIVD